MSDLLLHFSASPLRRIEARRQEKDPTGKPNGLWVSVGHEWAEWCRANDFGPDRFNYMTFVTLRDGASILRLSRATELDGFHREFACDGEENDWQRDHIHWNRVAEKYDGIIIAPYIWARRLRRPVSEWYYGWDVASGCIWNPRAVESLVSERILGPSELASVA